jgi:hypothetical protein
MSAPEALLVSDMAKWNAMAEEIAILRAQNAAVLAANRNCVDAFNELMEERNELLEALEQIERGEYCEGEEREIARAAIAKTKA